MRVSLSISAINLSDRVDTNEAVEDGLIERNPFAGRSVTMTRSKKEFVETDAIFELLPYCPDHEWKLLFVFARYMGPRIPSEIERLTWADVDWEQSRILLKSPKTEGRGRPQRLVPIFPELKPWLERQFHEAADGEKYVFPRLRHHANLGTTAATIVKRVHGRVWPSFWNSIRATRETELMDEYGLRRACSWIGNSVKVAMENYALMRTIDYLDVGSRGASKSDAKSAAIGCLALFSRIRYR